MGLARRPGIQALPLCGCVSLGKRFAFLSLCVLIPKVEILPPTEMMPLKGLASDGKRCSVGVLFLSSGYMSSRNSLGRGGVGEESESLSERGTRQGGGQEGLEGVRGGGIPEQ